jgi:hypothetical protein
MSFASNDLRVINESILAGGGGGGSATATNQTIQITEAQSTNTKLDNLNGEQGLSGVASGLSGTPLIITPTPQRFWTNLFIQAPDNLSGSAFRIEVTATSGTANYREVGNITINNQFFEYSGYFASIRITRLTGSATTLNWYVTNRPKGDATAKNQEDQTAFLTSIEANTVATNNFLNSDFNGTKKAERFSSSTLTGLQNDIDTYFGAVTGKKIIGFSMVHQGGTYEAIMLTTN